MDSDGLAIVDYFGEAFLPKEKEWIIKAKNFSDSERAKFEAKSDSTLAKRYDRLIAYINSRFPLWESPSP